MRAYPNIEKSVFRQGAYIGYCKGSVYLITRSNSSYGNWHAANRDNWNDQLFAFGLADLSAKLSQHNPVEKKRA
jgi:hypothetical protein